MKEFSNHQTIDSSRVLGFVRFSRAPNRTPSASLPGGLHARTEVYLILGIRARKGPSPTPPRVRSRAARTPPSRPAPRSENILLVVWTMPALSYRLILRSVGESPEHARRFVSLTEALMSETVQQQEPMHANLAIPPQVEEVIQSFEQADAPFTVRDVHQALARARHEYQDPSSAEAFGAWAETLAFALVGRAGASPWGTFFGPVGSETDEEGRRFYFPDIADATADVVAHWADRARSLTHPILRSRYADLVWEMAPVITGGRREPEMARLAIDAYLATALSAVLLDLHDRFEAALRALDLSCLIRDLERKEIARNLLMQLHREVVQAQKGPWWLAWDRLIQDKNEGLTDEERQELVDSMEELVLHFGDTADPTKFNPHAVKRRGDTADPILHPSSTVRRRKAAPCNCRQELRAFRGIRRSHARCLSPPNCGQRVSGCRNARTIVNAFGSSCRKRPDKPVSKWHRSRPSSRFLARTSTGFAPP